MPATVPIVNAISAVEVLRFEELTLNTAPAIQQYFYDGWVLRAAGCDSRRANSVTQLHASSLPLADKVAACEDWYAKQGQTPMFRLNDAISPSGLDALLDARGYTREINTVVMTVPLATMPIAPTHNPAPGLRLVARSITDGIADVHQLKGSAREFIAHDIARQQRWQGQQIFFSLRSINGLLACGMARLEAGYVCLFSLRTAPAEGGKGYAQLLVAHLLTWGREQGAHTGFLQVDENNAAAIAVYRRFGFAPRYPYWQRIAPTEPREINE